MSPGIQATNKGGMGCASGASGGASTRPLGDMTAPCRTSASTCTGSVGVLDTWLRSRAQMRRSASMEQPAARAVCWRRALRRLPGLRSSPSLSGDCSSAPCSTRLHHPARPATRCTAARIHWPGSPGPSQRSLHAAGTSEARSVAPSFCTAPVSSSAPRTTRAIEPSTASTAYTRRLAFSSSRATKRFTGVSRRPLGWRAAPSSASLRSSWLRSIFCQRLRSGESSAAQRSRSKCAAASAGVERVRRLDATCIAVRVATARSALSESPKSCGESCAGREVMART
mmetsp:Transcript_20767/g.61403  ORF Transcript_20767/g.61403 Transcript_20767/m.61403 type:complete len:284 (+) Transcript_20767:1003-1854(+)